MDLSHQKPQRSPYITRYPIFQCHNSPTNSGEEANNFVIHSAALVQLSPATPRGQRIKLHFLPPYCPDHNKIERTWHANVTRNHTCAILHELMRNVRYYLKRATLRRRGLNAQQRDFEVSHNRARSFSDGLSFASLSSS